MIRYEAFRHTIVGWFFVASFLLFTFPHINLRLWGDLQWAFLFVAGLISSPVFGYLVNQINRAYYIWRKCRPNDTKIEVEKLKAGFSSVVSELPKPDPALKVLSNLPPKDLHRFVWVSYANKELRDRSESYWERYYSNVHIAMAVIAGTALALSQLFISVPLWSFDTCWRFIVVLLCLVALYVTAKDYLRICMSIENTWIDSFLVQLRNQPTQFSNDMFRSKP